jgi:hypothetical protein
MYKPDIFNGIVNILADPQNIVDSLTYTALYNEVNRNLGRKVSRRDYSSNLAKMVQEKILDTKAINDKKKFKCYFLTEKARKMLQLNILGIGREYEKRLALYQLIIYFETFKRGQILTDSQLNRLLKGYGIQRKNLKKVDTIQFDPSDIEAAYEEPVNEIEIIQLPAGRFGTKSLKPVYYVLKLGLSVNEFLSYLKKVKSGKEPRPFSPLPSLVPFVHYTNYHAREVEDAISLLKDLRLLKQIAPALDRGDIRFRIADNRLIKLIQQIHLIEKIYFHKIFLKVAFAGPPDTDEKDIFAYYFGKERAAHVVAFLSSKRKYFFKTLTKTELQEKTEYVMNLCMFIEEQTRACIAENQEIIKDDFLKELYLPFSSYNDADTS